MNYKKYYNLEQYLLGEISNNFKSKGYLTAEEFFCIIIWKANRSKTKIKKRLKKIDNDLEKAVQKITSELFNKQEQKEKLRYLMFHCGFRLPMASAILTIFYPKEFTVYDVRVCDMLGSFHNLQNKTNLDKVWEGYIRFKSAVEKAVPEESSLRDKDRWLWGKSFHKDLKDFVER